MAPGRIHCVFSGKLEKNKMSDEACSCTCEYANKIKLCEPELRYISKVLERKPIFALAIPCSLLLEWHRFLSEKSSQLVDYTFLLEAAVKGHVLSFTDDKAKRHEMNKSLATLAGSVANLFRKTKGRAKQELVNKVKKFHVFEDQVKSWQSVETQVKKLETEIEEWKKKYKNVEKEKEDLFNQMTQIIHEKDRVISHLQKTNSELEDYVANLEKINGVQAEYKGKSLSVSQNKTRTLKNFLTRAEVALWFSKSFGLNIETILIRESDTGVKHTLDMRSQLPVPLSI